MNVADLPRDLEITVSDIRRAGHCANMRHFFRQHGIYDEFRTMIKGGSISSGKMLDTGDARAVNVVRLKVKGLAHGQE